MDNLWIKYNDIYSTIDQIELNFPLKDKNCFNYCCHRKYFVLIVPYNSKKEILVEREFAHNRLEWTLIGGSLRHDLKETFIDAANRLGSEVINNLQLGEIEPLTFCKNCFEYNNKKHCHYGVAFIGRIRNDDPIADLRGVVHSRGFFIPYNSRSAFSLPHNKRVFNNAKPYLKNLDLNSIPEDEVAENLKYKNRYVIHNDLAKPLFRTFGKIGLFKYSVQEFDQEIMKILNSGNHSKILDVACGENNIVFDFGQQQDTDLVVGNDISWSQIELMNRQFPNGKFHNFTSFILFTNHDARHFPFTDRYFDFVICKNVLHHMPNKESVENLINESIRVGKRILIIEIMNPKYENLWGRLRHSYYINYLHDAGSYFLSRRDFSEFIKPKNPIRYWEMATIRGIYLCALFENNVNKANNKKNFKDLSNNPETQNVNTPGVQTRIIRGDKK